MASDGYFHATFTCALFAGGIVSQTFADTCALFAGGIVGLEVGDNGARLVGVEG